MVVGDGTACYSATPILVYAVLSEGGSKGIDDHDRVASLDKRDNVPLEGVLSRPIDTIDLVAGLIIAEDEQQVLIAETVREIHRRIEGNLEDGRQYHAWNKDLWAGIIKPSIDAYERLHGPVSTPFAEDAYIGALQIGDLIGVRGLPETYSEFLNYWEHQWIPLADGTGTGRFSMSLIDGMPQPAAAPWIPKPIWHAMTWPLRHFMATSAFIVMEPRVLKMLGVEPTRGQRVGVGTHRLFWRLIPRAVTAIGSRPQSSCASATAGTAGIATTPRKP